MKDPIDREQGLQELAKAYLAVRDGKASCVMILIDENHLSVQTANVSVAEAVQAVAHANTILVKELVALASSIYND